MNIFSSLISLKNRRKIKDSIVLGSLAGLIGTIVMDVSNFLLWRSNKTEGLYGHLSGSMIMRSFRTHRRENFLIGQILHMATGMAFGIPMVYLFKKTSKDHHIYKGGLFGGLLWEIIFDFGKKMNLFSLKPRLTKSFYAGLLNNILYGITTAQVIVSFADSSVFPENNSQTVVRPEIKKQNALHINKSVVNNKYENLPLS